MTPTWNQLRHGRVAWLGGEVAQGTEWLRSQALRLVAIWRQRREESEARSALREMDDHMLDDIGMTRNDVDRMSLTPMWGAAKRGRDDVRR